MLVSPREEADVVLERDGPVLAADDDPGLLEVVLRECETGGSGCAGRGPPLTTRSVTAPRAGIGRRPEQPDLGFRVGFRYLM
jgi:hypothetical protein